MPWHPIAITGGRSREWSCMACAPIRFFTRNGLEEFRAWPAPSMEIVRTTDTGTLLYDLYFNGDPFLVHRPIGTGLRRLASRLGTVERPKLRQALRLAGRLGVSSAT